MIFALHCLPVLAIHLFDREDSRRCRATIQAQSRDVGKQWFVGSAFQQGVLFQLAIS